MKISNKEKIMLYILGIILIGFGYYNFVYSVQVTKIEQKLKEESEIKQRYTITMETIKALEDRKSDVKVLKAKINDQSSHFYPTVSEEHIIVELDKLLKDNGLKGGISFKPIVSDSVEASKKEQNALPESSFQGIVDRYNNITKNDTQEKSNNDAAQNNGKNATNNDQNNNGAANTKDSSNGNPKTNDTNDKKNTVKYLKCEVKFEGSYIGLDKFLNTIATNERKIVVNSIKVNQDTLDELKGTIELEFYSIPKITDELESYLKWDFNNTYGKNVPFSMGAASGVSDSSKDNSDFTASVKPTNSDLPTIMLGKADDSLRTTYVYADSNSEENVEMILTQDGNKYYYKYKTSKGSFPANYDVVGAEFIPTSKNIVIDILSGARINSDDKSSIKLKIVNKTDKLTEVNISGEDSGNPRVTVDGDGNNISVNQK